MYVTIDIRKTPDQNASAYFEKAKKGRKKIEGVRKIIDEYKGKLARHEEEEQAREQKKQERPKEKRKQDWYEKFRWFISSDGFIVIGGRDATTNEIVIKKHTDDNDLVFHTDMAGSPFVIVKRGGHEGSIPESTIAEAATFTAVFSRGWREGLAALQVFSVKPEQVSKIPNPGEYIQKGSFVIRGTTTYHTPAMEYGVGLADGRIMGGPLSAVKKHCGIAFVQVIQGKAKPSDVAKYIQRKVGGDVDDILRALPSSCDVKK